MKEKLTKNLGLKILSLLVAFLLWIIILNIDDPVVTSDTFRDIAVTKTNENALVQNDKVYDVVSGDTVDVKVRAKRSIIESLRKSDIQAVADLSQLSIVNAVPIVVTIPGVYDSIEIEQNTSTMVVSLENLVTKQFRIDVVTNGNAAAGYYVKDETTSPNIIQVSGAESVINKIGKVEVNVNVTNRRESFEVTELPKVYDNNGDLIDSSKISLNYEEVDVTVNLLKTKTVNLFIEVTGTPDTGYQYVKCDYEPKQVVIAGEQEELDKVQYIMGEYNIDNQNQNVEDTVNISDFIKNDVILIDDNQTAVINVEIQKLSTKNLSYNGDDIEVRNLPEGMAVAVDPDEIINVMLYGNSEELSTINKYNLKPYIDLSDTKTGTNSVAIQFDTPNDVTLVNPSVTITVSQTNG